MTTHPSQMFITGTDPHSPLRLVGLQLRSYLLVHGLLSEQLIIGDTQFNNNPAFRALLWADEPTAEPLEARHRDLGVLLWSGKLVPALRSEASSLEDIRKDHATRQVKNTPPEEYVEFINQNLDGRRVDYHLPVVSQMFKNQVLEAFSSEETRGLDALSEQAQQLVYEYAGSQETLLFNSLKKWGAQEAAWGRITLNELDFIERVVGACYRLNIPRTLDASVDVRFPDLEYQAPVPLVFGTRQAYEDALASGKTETAELQPAVFLSVEGLSMLPARVLATIQNHSSQHEPLPEYVAVTSALEAYRKAPLSLEFNAFAASLDAYFAIVDLICQECLTRKEGARYLDLKQKAGAVTLKAGVEYGLEYLKLAPGVGTAAEVYSILNSGSGVLKEIKDAKHEADRYLNTFAMGRLAKREQFIYGAVR